MNLDQLPPPSAQASFTGVLCVAFHEGTRSPWQFRRECAIAPGSALTIVDGAGGTPYLFDSGPGQ